MILRRAQVDQELISLRAALLQVAERLSAIEIRGAFSSLEPFLDELQHLFLNVNDDVQQPNSLLRRTDIHVVGRRIGQERYDGVVVVEDRGIERVFGREDGTAEPTPKIEFPSQIEGKIPLIKEVPAGADPAVRPCRLLRLRKELSVGDAELGACGKDAIAGFAQGKVLVVRL